MMDSVSSILFLILSGIVLPAGYLALCGKMRTVGIPDAPCFEWFVIFGSYGGWLLAMALSPSGLAAGCVLFLVTFAPVGLLVSLPRLIGNRARSNYHLTALCFNLLYLASLGTMAAWALFSSSRR